MYVRCYSNNMLVTGTDDDVHLSNLEELLTCLRAHGIRVKNSMCSVFQESVE